MSDFHQSQSSKDRNRIRVSQTLNNDASTEFLPPSFNNALQAYIEYNKTLQAEMEAKELDRKSLLDWYEKELANLRVSLTEKNVTCCKLKKLEDDNQSLQRLYDDQKVHNSLAVQTQHRLDVLKKEFDEVVKRNRQYDVELQAARTEIASMQTQCEDANFYKSLSMRTRNSGQITPGGHSIFQERTRMLVKEYDSFKEEMTKELHKRENEVKAQSQKNVEDILAMNEQLQTKLNSKTAELNAALRRQEDSRSALVDREAEITMLKNRASQDTQLISQLNTQRESEVREIRDDYEALRLRYQEKVARENDLNKEQNRLQLESPQYKKRKVAARVDKDRQEHVTSAWFNGKIKLGCDDGFCGDMVFIINDGEKEMDLNEWKLRFEPVFGESIEYVIPPRLLAAGQSVAMWSIGLSREDEDNEVMNVAIPQSDEMRINLSNDMDGIEAVLELKKPRKNFLFARRTAGKSDN